jgi:type I restriction enzyme, S subunit
LYDVHDLKKKSTNNHGNHNNHKNQSADNLPKGWKIVELKEVCELNPKIPDREKIVNEMEVQFIPMKLVEQITNKIHLLETKKYCDVLKGSYTPFIDGDIIFAKVTPCMENGKIAVVKNLLNGIGFGSSEFHVLRCFK